MGRVAIIVAVSHCFVAAAVPGRMHAARTAFLQRWKALDAPGDREKLLSSSDIEQIYSIDCLKLKQENGPNAPCNREEVASDKPLHKDKFTSRLSIATYPSWRDKVCKSDGELFCDPEGLIPEQSRKNVTTLLQEFRETTLMKCGLLDGILETSMGPPVTGNNVPIVPGTESVVHDRNFHLGVAIAKDWPESESDPVTLQKFGLILLSRWGALPWYNGVDMGNGLNEVLSHQQYTSNCPNAAILILLPKYRVAYLSSPSCEFICQERGGAEVEAAAEAELAAADWSNGITDGLALGAAIEAGINAVQKYLNQTSSLSIQRGESSFEDQRKALRKWERRFVTDEATWVFVLRAVYVSFIVGFVCFVVSIVACMIAPKVKSLRRLR